MVIMVIMVVIVILFAFAVGFLSGVYIAAKKFTNDSIDDFCEVQHLRDENNYLKKKLGFDIPDDDKEESE